MSIFNGIYDCILECNVAIAHRSIARQQLNIHSQRNLFVSFFAHPVEIALNDKIGEMIHNMCCWFDLIFDHCIYVLIVTQPKCLRYTNPPIEIGLLRAARYFDFDVEVFVMCVHSKISYFPLFKRNGIQLRQWICATEFFTCFS